MWLGLGVCFSLCDGWVGFLFFVGFLLMGGFDWVICCGVCCFVWYVFDVRLIVWVFC